MSYFIKTGFWEKAQKGFKGWLNLDDIIKNISGSVSNTTTVLSDNSIIDISSIKSSLTSSASTRDFTISYSGDSVSLEIILETTTAEYTFPTNSLTVSEGVASGDNILSLSGASGDRYAIAIEKINDFYYIVSKNFGQ